MPDHDDLEAVVEEMRDALASEDARDRTFAMTRVWADRLDACITSDKPATTSEDERLRCTTPPDRGAIAEAAYCRECWDRERGETGSPEPSDEAVEAAAQQIASESGIWWEAKGEALRQVRVGLRAAYAVDRPASPAPREEADDGE